MIHNAVQHGRGLLDSIGRLIGLDSEEEGVVRLSESLYPVVDIWRLPEAAHLRNETLMAGATAITAVAAEFPFIGFRNQSTSGVIAVIESCFGEFNSNSELQWTLGAIASTDVDGLVAVHPLDTRRFRTGDIGTNIVTLIVGTGAAQVGELLFKVDNQTGKSGLQPAPIVVSPGFEVRCYRNTVNTRLDGGFWGRFRQLKPGEDETR